MSNHSTPASLLERLRTPGQSQAWDQFIELYTPYLYYWARSQGLQESDASDLVQEVFLLLMRKLPEFVYDRNGSFRQWLRTIAHNKWRELRRKKNPQVGAFDFADVIDDDSRSKVEEAEYKQYILQHWLKAMKSEFPPKTWLVFDEYVLQGHDPRSVAARHGITLGTVYGVKSKVLTRLREELAGLVQW
jgi:RNA polymerase sigma-70 factor (ECF subfamily)